MFLSDKFGQFTYFDLQLGRPDWDGKRVLDFGGNVGNLLTDPNCVIEERNYWCLDVEPEAIRAGQERYPAAHWRHYNRASFAFNPLGQVGLPLPEMGLFDFILAYSIFTHIRRNEMLSLVRDLLSRLSPAGVLAFTFVEPHYNPCSDPEGARRGFFNESNFEWRLRRMAVEKPGVEVPELLTRVEGARWWTLLNEDDLYVETEDCRDYPPEQQRSQFTYYTMPCMNSLFPGSEILPPPAAAYSAPDTRELQHCCVIRPSIPRRAE